MPALFDLVRRAYPYRDLSGRGFRERPQAGFRAVPDRRPSATCEPGWPGIGSTTAWPLCPARPSWRWSAAARFPTPGSTRSTSATTVRGWASSTRNSCFERRVGEAFVLGNATWRIDGDRAPPGGRRPAEGHPAVMPFWRGESGGPLGELGEAVGALCREIAGRLDDPDLPRWLEENAGSSPAAAPLLRDHMARQHRVAGVVPDDRTVLVETFRDPAGELGLAVLTPFGGKLHHGAEARAAGPDPRPTGHHARCLHGDDGLLIRLARNGRPAARPARWPDRRRGRATDPRRSCPSTALYGLRFRQNAARALLMPRPDPAKRTPLWLQRLRAKDLLQVVGKFPDFPIVVETFRECLDQDLDLPAAARAARRDRSGHASGSSTRQGEIASPFASELIFQFTPTYLYEWDEPRRADLRPGGPAVDEDLLDALLEAPQGARLLDPQALGRVEGRLRRRGQAPRTAEEMAETLRALGDLSSSELVGPMERFLEELQAEGRAVRIELVRNRRARALDH